MMDQVMPSLTAEERLTGRINNQCKYQDLLHKMKTAQNVN